MEIVVSFDSNVWWVGGIRHPSGCLFFSSSLLRNIVADVRYVTGDLVQGVPVIEGTVVPLRRRGVVVTEDLADLVHGNTGVDEVLSIGPPAGAEVEMVSDLIFHDVLVCTGGVARHVPSIGSSTGEQGIGVGVGFDQVDLTCLEVPSHEGIAAGVDPHGPVPAVLPLTLGVEDDGLPDITAVVQVIPVAEPEFLGSHARGQGEDDDGGSSDPVTTNKAIGRLSSAINFLLKEVA